jgi:hypothetical protein
VCLCIRRPAETATISAPVTGCAIRTALFLLKTKQPDNTIVVEDMVADGTQSPAVVTALISISEMDSATRPVRYRGDTRTAHSIINVIDFSTSRQSAGSANLQLMRTTVIVLSSEDRSC